MAITQSLHGGNAKNEDAKVLRRNNLQGLGQWMRSNTETSERNCGAKRGLFLKIHIVEARIGVTDQSETAMTSSLAP